MNGRQDAWIEKALMAMFLWVMFLLGLIIFVGPFVALYLTVYG